MKSKHIFICWDIYLLSVIGGYLDVKKEYETGLWKYDKPGLCAVIVIFIPGLNTFLSACYIAQIVHDKIPEIHTDFIFGLKKI